jgi:hypothetical protein
MNANYDFQIAKYINCVIQNWLLIPSFYWFSAILLKSFSIVSHITNLPHGWYPHIRSLFATLSYLLSSLSWWLCKNYVHTPTDVINAQWHVKFGLPFPFETHSQLTIVIDLHVIYCRFLSFPLNTAIIPMAWLLNAMAGRLCTQQTQDLVNSWLMLVMTKEDPVFLTLDWVIYPIVIFLSSLKQPVDRSDLI